MSRKSIILFDGICNLCNSSINLIIDLDRQKRFKFTSLQSEKGLELLKYHDLNITPETIILIENNKVYQKSEAVLKICKKLIFPLPILYAFIIIPKGIRDIVYDTVAANRYKWFGKKEVCRIPTPELKERFL